MKNWGGEEWGPDPMQGACPKEGRGSRAVGRRGLPTLGGVPLLPQRPAAAVGRAARCIGAGGGGAVGPLVHQA